MKTITIKVEQSHIDNAKNFIESGHPRCSHCAVSLAFKEVINTDKYRISTVNSGVRLYVYGNDLSPIFRGLFPSVVNRFIDEFDRGYKVQPISFIFDIPEEYLKEGVN